MMWRKSLSLFVLTVALPLAAQETRPDSRPADGPGRGWVIERVERLDADDYDSRESAMRELLAAGTAIEEVLKESSGQGSPERQARVAEILSRLRRRTESRAFAPRATEINLKLTERPLSEAYRRWSEASRAKLFTEAVRVDPSKSVTFDIEREPMLKVLDAIAESSGSMFQWDTRRKGYQLMPVSARQGPIAYAGPVRVALSSFQITRSTSFTLPATTSVSLNGNIDVEPSLPLFGLITPFKVTEAIDDKGRSIGPPDLRQNEYMQRTPDGQRSWWNVQLAAPESDAKSLKRLKVACRLLVAEETAVVEIAEPKSDSTVSFGDAALRVVVESMETKGESTSVVLKVEAPAPEGPIPAASRNQGTDIRVEAYAADGQLLDLSGWGTSGTAQSVRWSATIKGASPALLKVSVPTRVAEVVFEPVFEDLPLP